MLLLLLLLLLLVVVLVLLLRLHSRGFNQLSIDPSHGTYP